MLGKKMKLEAHIQYMYRDASNYKEDDELILPIKGSRKNAEALAFAMQDGIELPDGDVCFIPEALGLTELRSRLYKYNESGEPTEDDHCWHELCGVEICPVPDGPSAEERNKQAGIDCPAKSFEEFATAYLAVPRDAYDHASRAWPGTTWDPQFEDYAGPGWRTPTQDEIKTCIAEALAFKKEKEEEDSGPRP